MKLLSPLKLEDNSISKQLRYYKPNDTIFSQGNSGNTMYIILEGFVRVLYHSPQGDHLVGISGEGEVLGEKAILKPTSEYKRTFTAQAKTAATLLEISNSSLKTVLKNWPDFHLRVLTMIEERLDKANELITILQSPIPMNRFYQYLFYFHKHHLQKLPEGTYITMTVSEIQYAVNLDKAFVENAIKLLVQDKVLSPLADGYAINDIKLLDKHATKSQALKRAA